MTAEKRQLLRLRGSVKDYDWGRPGATSLVAKLAPEAVDPDFKVDPAHPYAEVWMGTHISGPSSLYDSPSRSLKSIINSDPSYYLGSGLLERWPSSTDIPFLFKILSIAKALPLQAHPDKDLGAQLHARDAGEFVDANHKPEIAVAVGGKADPLEAHILHTDTADPVAFTGFVGFQPLTQIAQALTRVPELARAVGDRAAVDAFVAAPSQDGLRAVYSALLTHGKDNAAEVAKEVEELVRRVVSAGWGEVVDEQTAVRSKLVVKIHEQYPGDVGVFSVPFFMNLVRLRKGEAVYIGADEVHAYLEGDIVECMAASDNVVNAAFVPPDERGVRTFTTMLTYTSRAPSHWALAREACARSSTGQTSAFAPPLEEFDVLWTALNGTGPETLRAANGPTIGIVTGAGAGAKGATVRVTAGADELELPEGGVFYVVPGVDVTVQVDEGTKGEIWWATCSL